MAEDRRTTRRQAHQQSDVVDCDAVAASKISEPVPHPIRVRRGVKSTNTRANSKRGPENSAVDESTTIDVDRKVSKQAITSDPIVVDSGSDGERWATLKPNMKAHVRRTKSGRQSVISDSILVGYRSKNMIAVELATRGNESNVIVLDSSSDDDSKACKGDNVSPNPGQNKVSKASRRRASAEDDVPPMTKGSTDLGSLLQSERKYSVSNVEKEFQRSSRSQLSLVPQNSPDEAGSSSDEETAPSQRAPSVFVSPPRELEQRDKHVEFLVTTRRRNRILHFKEGEFDSPATGMDENQHRDIAKASGTQQNPMVVWSSLPPVPKEKDQNPNPRLERKKAASRPSNLLQQLLGQREESLKARTPSRTTETGIGTSLKSSNAGDNNPFIDEKTRHKDRTTATNRSNDANRIPHSLDPGKGRDVKKDAKPFVVPSVVNKTQENAPGEQSLCIDSVLNSFSNLSISTTKKPIIELTVTLKTDISKPEGNSSTNSNNGHEGPSVTKATKNRTHTGDSLSSAISRGRECRSNERNVVEKQIKHQDSLTDDLIGSFTQLNVSKEGRIKTTFGPNSRQAEIVQKAAESAEIHPAPVKAKAQAPNVDGKVRRRLVIHSDDEDTEDGVEDRSRRAGPPQSTQKIAIPIPADQMSSKEHKTQSIEGKRRLHPIYLSSDDELSPVKRVDRPKLQPSSVQKRVDAAKQIHQPAGSFHPTVSTPHNMFSDPAVPPARKGRSKIWDSEINDSTPAPARNPPKSVWSPEDRPAAVPSTPKTVKRKLFVSNTTGTNREHLTFKLERETIAVRLYEEFNEKIFGSLLPDDLEISWSAKLVATAGISRLVTRKNTKTGIVTRKATIELSNKVLDTIDRLRSTLAHEMCHVAAFWIDGNTKPPHGAVFKKWGQRVMRCYSDIEVTTCHSYEIAYTHWYECENMFCGRRYGRFSKSIDVRTQRCGICGGKLRYLERNCKDGKARKENLFQAFLKERLKTTKAIFPGLPHKEVMQLLSDEWKEVKSSWIAGRKGSQLATEAVPSFYGGEDWAGEENDDESSEEDLSFVVPDDESFRV